MELLLANFEVRRGNAILRPVAYDEEGDVVAGERLEVGIDAEKGGGRRGSDAGFLSQLAYQGLGQRLAQLNAAAGKMPARGVAMANQQHAPLPIQDYALRAHRESPP